MKGCMNVAMEERGRGVSFFTLPRAWPGVICVWGEERAQRERVSRGRGGGTHAGAQTGTMAKKKEATTTKKEERTESGVWTAWSDSVVVRRRRVRAKTQGDAAERTTNEPKMPTRSRKGIEKLRTS